MRGITAENLPDIEATNALVMGKDGTVYYARGADEQVKIRLDHQGHDRDPNRQRIARWTRRSR